MEEGLYKKSSDTELLYAENAIYYPDETVIYVSDYKNSDKEYDGWRYFFTRRDAYEFFGIEEPPSI